MKDKIFLICGWLIFLVAATAAGDTGESDSLIAQIIWIEPDRVYLNLGARDGITPGWNFLLPFDSTGDSTSRIRIIDQVYPDISSAPVRDAAPLDTASLTGLPEVWLYAPPAAVVHLPHLRIGIVNQGKSVDRPVDMLQFPLLASMMWPWTCSDPVDPRRAGMSVFLLTPEGRHWAVGLDASSWPEGEFPRSWGALADRLNGIIDRNEQNGCPTLWALRPPEDDPLDREGVLFEGFFYENDSTVGLEYSTPFHTFAEYANAGWWRRAVAAAGHFDAELNVRPPGWTETGPRTWTASAELAQNRSSPFRIDTITVRPYPEHSDQWLDLELDKIDICAISIDDLLRTPVPGPGYRTISATQNALVVFGVNQQKRELADNRLTTAAGYLVDKSSLVRALLAGRGSVTHSILAEHDSLGEAYYPFDPRKGRRILKDLRLRRRLNFYVDTRIDRGKTIAEHIAGKLADGGIKTRVIPAGPEQFAAPDFVNSMDIFLYYWPVSAARPDVTFYSFVYSAAIGCGTNPLILDNPEFLALVEKARREEAPAARNQYYRELEYHLLTEPYLCPLYRPIKSIAVSNRLPEIGLTGDGEIYIVPSVAVNKPGEAGQ